MRILGIVMFLAGGAGTGYATWAMFQYKRPKDIGFALLAPIALVAALAGLLLAFVPGFFG